MGGEAGRFHTTRWTLVTSQSYFSVLSVDVQRARGLKRADKPQFISLDPEGRLKA
jgi:hypothetical protein